MKNLTILCQLNNGCMGCCGHSFISEEKIKKAILRNTREFNESNPKTKEELKKFRERYYSYNLLFGVCRNLIEKGGQIFCPLHPQRCDGNDLRLGHCDTNYLCKTAKKFSSWNKEIQEKFINFIKDKNLDNIKYSIKMDNNSLLEEFKDFLS